MNILIRFPFLLVTAFQIVLVLLGYFTTIPLATITKLLLLSSIGYSWIISAYAFKIKPNYQKLHLVFSFAISCIALACVFLNLSWNYFLILVAVQIHLFFSLGKTLNLWNITAHLLALSLVILIPIYLSNPSTGIGNGIFLILAFYSLIAVINQLKSSQHA